MNQMNTRIDPNQSPAVSALKRRLAGLYKRRNALYAKHLAGVDERISTAERELHRLIEPQKYCKCGTRFNIGTKCSNEACDNYSGVPF
jgi:hypothetical protein